MIVAMALGLVQVNIKVRDDAALGRFWAEALGWSAVRTEATVTNVRPEGYAWPNPTAV
jgi:hypothetical protein